jgi:hypothetical protein
MCKIPCGRGFGGNRSQKKVPNQAVQAASLIKATRRYGRPIAFSLGRTGRAVGKRYEDIRLVGQRETNGEMMVCIISGGTGVPSSTLVKLSKLLPSSLPPGTAAITVEDEYHETKRFRTMGGMCSDV